MFEDFFQNILELKKIKRKGWIDKLGIDNPESVADHSYSMTFLSLLFSEIRGLDSEKIMKMALLHDLAESEVGDLTPDEISKEKKIELENNSMKKILEKLPTELSQKYQNVWDEFLSENSKESVLVHDIDNLEMVIQAKNYMDQGHSRDKIQPFIDSAKNKIKNEELKGVIDKIFDKNV